jgi:hypothetical protein
VGRYEDGWFFGYTLVTVEGAQAKFEIKELGAPYGQGRVTSLAGIARFFKVVIIFKSVLG